MRVSAIVAAISLAACNGSKDVGASKTAAPPERIASGVPHAAAIKQIALAETGDAAVTVDTLGKLRLWPSLDSTRPAVPIIAFPPVKIALGHTGADLLVSILDQADNIQLLRLGRDRTVHRRAQISVEGGCADVIALDDGVLVLRRDQSIERFDASGLSTGRIVPESGERIVSIPARHGAAIALIGIDRAEPSAMHWIGLDRVVHWGTRVALPEPVTDIALAPSHDRVAVIYKRDSSLRVFDLAAGPTLVPGSGSLFKESFDFGFGFIDNDRIAMFGSHTAWWSANALAGKSAASLSTGRRSTPSRRSAERSPMASRFAASALHSRSINRPVRGTSVGKCRARSSM